MLRTIVLAVLSGFQVHFLSFFKLEQIMVRYLAGPAAVYHNIGRLQVTVHLDGAAMQEVHSLLRTGGKSISFILFLFFFPKIEVAP